MAAAATSESPVVRITQEAQRLWFLCELTATLH